MLGLARAEGLFRSMDYRTDYRTVAGEFVFAMRVRTAVGVVEAAATVL